VPEREHAMGAGGFVLGSVVGMFAGAWVYWRVLGDGARSAMRTVGAAVAAGLTTMAVDTVLFIPLGVHTWVGGIGTPWATSVFLALCLGVCQGVLFRGRPLPPSRTKSGSAD
jgi:hypothetical protein